MNIFDDEHHWSGWPGAYCLKCGAKDPREESLAMGLWDVDPETEIIEWLGTTEQLAAERAAMVCSVKGTLEWDPVEQILKLEPPVLPQEPTSA